MIAGSRQVRCVFVVIDRWTLENDQTYEPGGAILLDLRVGTLLEEEEEEEEEDESRHESKKRAGAILSNNSPEQERNRAAQNAYLKVEKSESVTSMKRSGKTVVLSVTTCNCKALVEFRRLRR